MTAPIPEQGLATTLNVIRPLDDSEHRHVVEAEEILNRFGPTWPHTVAIHLAAAFIKAVQRMEVGGSQTGGQVNESDLGRVSGSLGTFAEHVTHWIAGTTSKPGLVADVAAVVAGTPPVILCQRIASGEASVLAAGTPQQVVVRLNGSTQVDAGQLVMSSLSACRALADAELVEAEPSLLVAGAVVMGLRAEVVWGEPTLLRTGDVQPGKMELSPHPIEWQKVGPIMTACAIARAAVAQRSGNAVPAVPPPDGAPEEVVSPQGPPPDPPTVQDDSTEDPPESDILVDHSSNSPTAAPADIASLLHEVTSLAQSTEQRWSKALGESISDDISDFVARARSLAASLARLEIQDGKGGPVLPDIPLTAASANELSLTPNGEQREVQHGVAVIQVLLELAQAIDSLSRPTGLKVDLLQGTPTSWWTQHGFNHLQYRAEMANRVVTEGAMDPARLRNQMSRLALAAWTAGLPEATIVYLVGALDPSTEAVGHLSGAYGTLMAAAKTLAAGDHASLDAVVPIGRFWLDELARRIENGVGSGDAIVSPT
jgi:hypothetical protein